MAETLAGLYAGVLYALCGWNKLYHPQRRREMSMTMRRVFEDPMEASWMATLVSMTQLVVGSFLAVWSLAPNGPTQSVMTVLAIMPLMAISAVGFLSVGIEDMKRQWRPSGKLDYVACVMWTSEVQLFTLLVIALWGTLF